ncbi:hypothetical protein REDROCK_69 [Mycobacterium phage RedRock]|uniref:Uncharacterized protein n=1 Tax=Mycobacterium phage RedRock TaxID=711470 RepID=D3JZD1_9CAUD|nr:hypothetical protein REDROCK_69 [Mycobacterium phage RedRock]ADB93762.1 hypothetical protein REDROCK_69 [Mycobacterium phage RedRock]
MTPTDQLRQDLRGIARAWLFHGGGSIDALVNAVYDFIIETYGPPF